MKRLLTTTIGVAAVALALTACGAGDSPDSKKDPIDVASESESADGVAEGDLRNGPVPDADPEDAWEKDLPAEPDRKAPLGEQIEYKLVSAAAEFTHQYDDKAKIDCPDVKGTEDENVTCELTYFEQEVSWKVAITGGSMVASFKYESDKGVLSREYLENALRYKAKAEDVMCELDEEFTAVDTKSIEPVVCHSLADGEQSAWEIRVGTRGSTTFSQQ